MGSFFYDLTLGSAELFAGDIIVRDCLEMRKYLRMCRILLVTMELSLISFSFFNGLKVRCY